MMPRRRKVRRSAGPHLVDRATRVAEAPAGVATDAERRTMDLRRNSWFLLLLPLLWANCSQGELFREEQSFGAGGWHRDQAAEFEVEVQDTTQLLDIGLTLTHGEDYPYSNLWVFVDRSEEHTSELQSRPHLVCRLLLEKKKKHNEL